MVNGPTDQRFSSSESHSKAGPPTEKDESAHPLHADNAVLFWHPLVMLTPSHREL